MITMLIVSCTSVGNSHFHGIFKNKKSWESYHTVIIFNLHFTSEETKA